MTFEEKSGKTIFRYMSPLRATEGCLNCHEGRRGFTVGGVGGGISIRIPADALVQQRSVNLWALLSSLAFVLVLFLGSIIYLYRHLIRNVLEHEQSLVEQEKLRRQTQKQSALGSLAGGMAHEFNNLLLPIMSLTEMTLRGMPDESRERRRLEKVFEASSRAKVLVDHVMMYSRQTETERKNQDLRSVVAKAMAMAHPTMPATIKITENLADDTMMVFIDFEKIETLMINLLSNAVISIGDKVGEIAIGLSMVSVEAHETMNVNALKPGRYGVISVEDTGCGMNEETLLRAFDPFFTTSEVGEGTGMGLATVAGIVTEHGGAVGVSSFVGKGTRVDVYLPLVETSD